MNSFLARDSGKYSARDKASLVIYSLSILILQCPTSTTIFLQVKVLRVKGKKRNTEQLQFLDMFMEIEGRPSNATPSSKEGPTKELLWDHGIMGP